MRRVFMCVMCCAAVLLAQPTASRNQARKDTLQYSAAAVTVVATRQPQYNLDVPLATTVVPKEQFQSGRNYGLDEALSLVPGALVQSRTGNHDVRVLIRGFGARGAGERSNAGTSRGVRFYIDGFPVTEPDGRTAFDLVDLGSTWSIEVLRSNASALWGNAAGGVVQLSTLPPLGARYAIAEIASGSFGFLRSALRLASPLGDGVAYANVTNTSFDGWREHSRSSNFQVTAGAVTQLAERTRLGVFAVGASNTFRIPGPLTEAEFAANPRKAQDDPAVYNPTYVARDERRSNRLGRIGARIEHGIGESGQLTVQLFAEPKFLQRSERNTFRDFTRYHIGGSALYSHASELSDNVRNTLLIGADEQYQDGAILFYALDLATGGSGALQTNKREGAENTGVFVQDEFTVGRWSLLIGVRQDWLSYYYADFLRPQLNDRRTYGQLSPKVGITYRATGLLSFYANYSRGVEIPAGNEVDPPSVFGEDTVRLINPLLEPIRSETFELGAKHILAFEGSFLRALGYDVAAYLITTRNDLIPYRGGRYYLSAGRTERIGAEIGFSAEFREGIRLLGMLTVLQTKLAEYVIDSVYTKATYDPSLQGKKADLSGNAMPGVPNVFATVRLQYQPTWLERLRLELELRHVGSYYADDRNRFRVPAYTVLDAGIRYEQPLFDGTSLIAELRGMNLTDARYVASAWINPDVTSAGAAYIEPGLPRNVMGRLIVQQRW